MAEKGNVLEETRAYLQERLAAVDDERRKLERALAALTDGRSGRRGPGRPRTGEGRACSGAAGREPSRP